ncbi:MAG: phosphatase PAP2 family protein [Sphingomicrobium sp.]
MLLKGSGPLDRATYVALYSGQQPVVAGFAHALTTFGDPNILVAASLGVAIWLYRTGHRNQTWLFLGTMFGGRALVEAQKLLVDRPRPAVEAHLVVVKTASFPSGHAANSMIFYVTLALLLATRTRWKSHAIAGAILLSLMIGTSRVMLGVHWPSDVIGGWTFGLLWVVAAIALAQRAFKIPVGTHA